MEKTDPERMECMEVWGGNQAVQRSFITPGLKIYVDSQPYGQAPGGGDVYYLSSCASGRITRMLLADVSGHGELVSQTAVGLRDLMRRNVNYIKQTRFVRAMNRQFADLGEQGGFATALVSTFFATTMTYSLCNAGHPVPLVFRRGTSQWTELKNEASSSRPISDTPLGVVDEASYGQLDVRLEAGDMVLSFSDAVTESEDGDGRQLGVAGVLRLVRELGTEDSEKIIPALVERIRGLRDSNLRQDDATFLLGQATGGGPSMKNNLLAPLRFLRRTSDHTRIA
ncbi:PP2C family protein-serine/threonine phosphatase [Bythopirellula polymerisocia]|uniref:Stage II sporulation protein E (SpoIIE) n=1 Tax=Bythopirellula polymerisocia TaxID=2528003 RepID=A0A5C6D0U6_9BACT|nr:PP2C family protein-serine/threonine phosphatase [Bythopirellula polymerisocia]TWU30532.1 Stage II sporulation protein E (SpoIIE) [Bythopirellula polymerisocia]